MIDSILSTGGRSWEPLLSLQVKMADNFWSNVTFVIKYRYIYIFFFPPVLFATKSGAHNVIPWLWPSQRNKQPLSHPEEKPHNLAGKYEPDLNQPRQLRTQFTMGLEHTS